MKSAKRKAVSSGVAAQLDSHSISILGAAFALLLPAAVCLPPIAAATPAVAKEPIHRLVEQHCFDCHDERLVLDAISTETGFRNGKENLHYFHVNREKGRTCRACHQEHGSNQPKHIRSVVPFGRWEMKLDYTITETGGGCSTGCHVPKKYDRVTPVDNSQSSAP